ncbi:MAG: hypothetical protein HY952_06820 [Elusimicrobia bacterium]|nr:hypothetical protein [Elusimicrobiota bacterium]
MKNETVKQMIGVLIGAVLGVGINMVPGVPSGLKWVVLIAVIIAMPYIRKAVKGWN